MRVNVNDFDQELWNAAADKAYQKGYRGVNNKSLLNFILKEFIQLSELEEIDNPLFLKKIQQIVSAEVNLSEKRLGGRLFSLVGDNTINLSILNQIMFESVQKYDDTTESQQKMEQYRNNAVENLRNRKKPITYVQLIKDEDYDG